MESYKAIISTEELEKILGQENVKVLDCSVGFGRQEGDCPRLSFLRSHIKGALFLDLDYFKDMTTDLPYMMPTEEDFVATMKRLNVRLGDKVVCYDASPMQLWGYRVSWMLSAMGHPDASVLDGGFAKWQSENKPCESTNPNADAAEFGYKLNPDKIKTLEQMQAFESDEAGRTFQVVDSRPGEPF